jgi:acetyl-CoA carboxylase biotin carboxyl carrier protein|tara:strand:+ start:1219 stop:1638 length:420 start_codon:yes stop_codon:yes gene_type:complete
VDLRKIKKLIELVEESGISELEVKTADEGVRIVRPTSRPVVAAPIAADPLSVPVTPMAEERAGAMITAPMAGTFYVAPEPDATPFAPVGARVEAGSIVCIIESMKMMNEITAEGDGTIAEVLVENGQPIATGQALFRIS